jgi:hypothetical protein
VRRTFFKQKPPATGYETREVPEKIIPAALLADTDCGLPGAGKGCAV